MEAYFKQLKSENDALSKKIPLLKNEKIVFSKKLESYSFNKKYPNKVDKINITIFMFNIFFNI